MIRLLFMFSVMLLGIVFLVVPDAPPQDFFPFADMKVTPEWYVYYLIESLIIIIFAGYLVVESKDFKTVAVVFLILQTIELIDFVLTYNMAWFEYRGYPITYNVIKVLVFILVLIYEYAWDYFTSDPTGDVPRT
jgi:hypothetical protein